MKIYKVEHVVYDWDNDYIDTIGYFKDKEVALNKLKSSLEDNWRSSEFKLKESGNIGYIRESDCQTEWYYLEEVEVI